MNSYIIVGGGVTGLLAARELKDNNQTFVGIEKSGRLGGRAESGPHRALQIQTTELFRKWAPEILWTAHEDESLEWFKGEWIPLKDNYSEAEKFYLRNTHFSPEASFEKILEKLSAPVSENFLLNKTVVQIHGDKKIVELSDGTEHQYEKLLWCSDFHLLFRIWKGEALHLPKGTKKSKEQPAGFNLTWELNSQLFKGHNTVVFPFRLKEHRLRAMGIPDWNDAGLLHRIHWLVFLPKEVMEDREEVAKCVRTLKRELMKEFPELNTKIIKERLVYLPLLSGEEPVLMNSLEIAPDVFCLGPQIRIGDEVAELKNMDLLAAQMKLLTPKILPMTP